jgi:hypothetical protein
LSVEVPLHALRASTTTHRHNPIPRIRNPLSLRSAEPTHRADDAATPPIAPGGTPHRFIDKLHAADDGSMAELLMDLEEDPVVRRAAIGILRAIG